MLSQDFDRNGIWSCWFVWKFPVTSFFFFFLDRLRWNMSLGYVTVNIQKMSYKKMELLTGSLLLKTEETTSIHSYLWVSNHLISKTKYLWWLICWFLDGNFRFDPFTSTFYAINITLNTYHNFFLLCFRRDTLYFYSFHKYSVVSPYLLGM